MILKNTNQIMNKQKVVEIESQKGMNDLYWKE
jgi:hypothetical protein